MSTSVRPEEPRPGRSRRRGAGLCEIYRSVRWGFNVWSAVDVGRFVSRRRGRPIAGSRVGEENHSTDARFVLTKQRPASKGARDAGRVNTKTNDKKVRKMSILAFWGV